MHLAVTTSPMPIAEAFAAASTRYNQAIDLISPKPNERIDVRTAVASSIEQATEAVALLAPFTNANADMFTERNASASVKSAETGLTALRNALATIDAPGAGMPQIPVATFLEMARNSFRSAESALWWE